MILIFFSIRERAVFYKSCNLIGSESRQKSPKSLSLARKKSVSFNLSFYKRHFSKQTNTLNSPTR